MTDPDSRPAPPRPADPPRRIPTGALGVGLSFLLVAGWLVFLNLAPPPEVVPPNASAPLAAPPAANDELRVLVWRDMLDPESLADFETETTLKIVREGYTTGEQLAALIDGGLLSHDLVLVPGADLKPMLDKGLLAPLPPLANAANIDPVVSGRAAVYDPTHRYGVVALWGTLGLAFDGAKAAERLGAATSIDSWSALFDPATVAKFANCGVQIVDSPRGVFPIALTYLGLPEDSAKAEDTEAATRAWEALRPSITAFSTQGIVENLAEGRVCFALATSGDAARARAKAQSAGTGIDIRYVLPKEGTVAWYGFLAVPKSAANSAHAAKLIDYLLRPQVAARLTNATGLGNAVRNSALYVRPDLQADAALMPDAAAARFAPEVEPSPAVAALRSRFWQLINAPPAPAPVPAPAQ